MIMILCVVILLIRLTSIQSMLWNPTLETDHYLYSRKRSLHIISKDDNGMKGETDMERLPNFILEDHSNTVSSSKNKSSTAIRTKENSSFLFFSPDIHDGTMIFCISHYLSSLYLLQYEMCSSSIYRTQKSYSD